MKFITTSGSVYEVDEKNHNIRRLIGKGDPTPRQGKDGEWRKYAELRPSPLEIGAQAMIVWGSDVPLLPETVLQEGESAIKITTTSLVIEIDEASN